MTKEIVLNEDVHKRLGDHLARLVEDYRITGRVETNTVLEAVALQARQDLEDIQEIHESLDRIHDIMLSLQFDQAKFYALLDAARTLREVGAGAQNTLTAAYDALLAAVAAFDEEPSDAIA